jgi:hypothetical protein
LEVWRCNPDLSKPIREVQATLRVLRNFLHRFRFLTARIARVVYAQDLQREPNTIRFDFITKKARLIPHPLPPAPRRACCRMLRRLLSGSAALSPRLASRKAGSGVLILSVVLIGHAGRAYVLEGPSWSSSPVTFQLALGNSSRTLSDGNRSWDTAVSPAFGLWNQYIQGTQLNGVNNASAPVNSGDHVNTIAFSGSVFGHTFGANTLALTSYRSSGNTMTEADILFNNHQSWDSYRGSLRFATDIRRVLVHELGHALGLDHPDESGQRVSAIMNSLVGNLEAPIGDDIAGARAIYGARISPTPTPTPSPSSTPTPTPTPTPSPTIALSVSPTSITEGGSATFVVTASGVSTSAMTVPYSMRGKAVYGKHYTLSGTAGQVTIPAGSTTATVTLNSIPNSIKRRPKRAKMTLHPGFGYQLSSSISASVTIVNAP